VNHADIAFLLGYDRWATLRILAVADGVDEAAWGAAGVVGDRGLGSILVHQLGAALRWRHRLAELPGDEPRPEREPLPTPDGLARRWAAEWDAQQAWLAGLTDGWLARSDSGLARRDDGVPFWQLLAHVVNHGTQHRAEAAALLTLAGRSPGDLDLVFYAEEVARTSG
jgi:uncharacterized damage-inducible protein DinB